VSDIAGADEGSGGVEHGANLRAEQHRALAESGKPDLSRHHAKAVVLGAGAQPHAPPSHPQLVPRNPGSWLHHLGREPGANPRDSQTATGPDVCS